MKKSGVQAHYATQLAHADCEALYVQGCADKATVLLAWQVGVVCGWAELFSQPGTSFFSQHCTTAAQESGI